MAQVEDSITLINAITSPLSNSEYLIHYADKIFIEISGTSTSRTVTFNKKVFAGGITVPINAYNDATSVLAVSTTNNNEVWELDPAGISSIIINVTTVAGGNVTIKVKAIQVNT